MALDPEPHARATATVGAAATSANEQTFAAVGLDSQAVIDAPVAICSVDLQGRVRSWNGAAEALFGWTAAEVLGEPVPFVSTDAIDETAADVRRLLDGGQLDGVEFSARHKDGSERRVVASATAVPDAAGRTAAIVVFASDVTASRAATEVLDRAHERWRHLLASIGDTVVVVDEQATVRETTGSVTASDGLVGRNVFEFVHEDDLPRAREVWDRLLRNPGEDARDVFRTRRADGSGELIEYNAVSLLHDPVLRGVVVTARNVTNSQRAEALLADEAEVLELIARDAPLGEALPAITSLMDRHTGGSSCLLLLAPGGRFLRVGSPGTVPEPLLDLLLATPLDFSPTGEPLDLSRPIVVTDYRNDPRLAPYADRFAAAGAGSGWSVPVIENRSGELLGVLSTFYDEPRSPSASELEVADVATHLAAIAIDRHRVQDELYHQARHHPLTGLPNRTLILEELAAALERARRAGTTLAVVFVDLDRFKIINDSLGHAAGDTLLVRFGSRLRGLIRPGDFVGHFGADEFVLLVENLGSPGDVTSVTTRLELALSEPFELDEGDVYLSASIGVATASGDTAPQADDLIEQADAAMFRAKDLGRDRIEMFDETLRHRAVEQLRLDRELRAAVERAELALHFQPVVELASGRIIGAEALLRWNHPDRGLLHPADFLASAEESGIIVRIGRWVLEEAVNQARTWTERHPGNDGFVISVNVSARQLSEPGLAESVSRVIRRYDWPAAQLLLELTEQALVDERDASLEVMAELNRLGVGLAIDDFGTGFSSLNHLHRFPIGMVKIDRAFVTDLAADGTGSPVATAIVHMADALSLEPVAEGVETADQRNGLLALGCRSAQGYLFARPLPSEQFDVLLAAGSAP